MNTPEDRVEFNNTPNPLPPNIGFDLERDIEKIVSTQTVESLLAMTDEDYNLIFGSIERRLADRETEQGAGKLIYPDRFGQFGSRVVVASFIWALSDDEQKEALALSHESIKAEFDSTIDGIKDSLTPEEFISAEWNSYGQTERRIEDILCSRIFPDNTFDRWAGENRKKLWLAEFIWGLAPEKVKELETQIRTRAKAVLTEKVEKSGITQIPSDQLDFIETLDQPSTINDFGSIIQAKIVEAASKQGFKLTNQTKSIADQISSALDGFYKNGLSGGISAIDRDDLNLEIMPIADNKEEDNPNHLGAVSYAVNVDLSPRRVKDGDKGKFTFKFQTSVRLVQINSKKVRLTTQILAKPTRTEQTLAESTKRSADAHRRNLQRPFQGGAPGLKSQAN